MDKSSPVALLALLLCPVVVLLAFRRATPAAAASSSMIGAAVLLPESVGFDPPLLPMFDKHSIAALSVLVAAYLFARPRMAAVRPFSGLGVLLLVMMAGDVGTALTNGDTIAYGPKVLQALGVHDILSMWIEDLLQIGVPFILGRALIRDTNDHRMLMSRWVGWALFYSLFILIEVRLSPQMHDWIYGFHQHSFAQAKREGGFRPMVFMEHGLAVSLFITMSVLCAVAVRRGVQRIGPFTPMVAAGYLFVVLVLCKSLGALVYAIAVLPILLFAGARLQIRVAWALAILVLLYPVLRTYDAFPTDTLVELGNSIGDDERSSSLQFRFDNEDLLLEHTVKRGLFGWGGFRRSRLFDDQGEGTTTVDGYWIIVFGKRGWIGVAVALGLLVGPILLLARRFNTIQRPEDQAMLAGLAMTLAVGCIDLLPNGLFTRLPFFLAGALLGLVEGTGRRRPRKRTKPKPADEPSEHPRLQSGSTA